MIGWWLPSWSMKNLSIMWAMNASTNQSSHNVHHKIRKKKLNNHS
jgi:hypothetical protein